MGLLSGLAAAGGLLWVTSGLRGLDPWETDLYSVLAALSGAGVGALVTTVLSPRWERAARDRRRRTTAGWAADRGWQFRASAPVPDPDLCALLLPPGVEPVAAADLVRGIYRGLPASAFLLTGRLSGREGGTANGRERDDRPLRRVAVLSTPTPLPALAVCRRRDRAYLHTSLARRRVEVGVPEFDQEWSTFSTDAKAAASMLTPERIARILGTDLRHCVVFSRGCDLVGIGDPDGDVEAVVQLLHALAVFAE